MADPIVELLCGGELRTPVVKILTETCIHAKAIYENPRDDMKEFNSEDLWGEAWWRAQSSIGLSAGIAFHAYLFGKLSKPFRITPQEIWDAFWVVAKPLQHSSVADPSKYAESIYPAFVNLVANQRLSNDASTPLVIAIVNVSPVAVYQNCSGAVTRTQVHIPDDPAFWLDHSDDIDAALELEEEGLWGANGLWVGQVDTSPCTDMARYY